MPLKVYDGSKWIIAANVNIWDGSSWVTANGSVWDGSSWVKYHPGVYLAAAEPAPAYYGYSFSLASYANTRVVVYSNGHMHVLSSQDGSAENVLVDEVWRLTGDASDYDVKIINYSGNGSVIGGSMSDGLVYPSTDNPYFGIEAYAYNAYYADINLQITANNTGTVLANTSISFVAEVINPFGP